MSETRDVGGGGAASWLAENLATGGALARAAQDVIAARTGDFVAVAGGEVLSAEADPETSPGVESSLSDAALTGLFERLCAEPFLLVVEDDLARPGDPDWAAGSTRPVLERADSVVHGGRVLHRMLVDKGSASAAASFLRGAASGYPTLAFVATGMLSERARSRVWDDALVADLAQSLRAIIVSAFDAEGWIVWTPRSERQHISHLAKPES